MARQKTRTARWVAPLLLLMAVVAAVAAIALTQSAPDTGTGQPAYVHPSGVSVKPCSSCKAPKHDYTHQPPYQGDCLTCHTLDSWRDVHYDHAMEGFDVSLHAVVGCPRCHTEGDVVTARTCVTCHASKSKHGAAVTGCASCHTAVSWTVPRPLPEGHLSLAGGHAGVDCFQCHRGARAPVAVDRGCVDCHGRNHGGLTSCEDCHDPSRGWAPAPDFDHAAFFPLLYRHSQAACTGCHGGGRFAGTPTNCSGCHDVVHANLTSCERCHTPAGFKPSTFNHTVHFKITGRHLRLTCAQCHKRGVYKGTSTRCSGCHGTRHGGLSACQSCHTTAGFTPSTFKHSSVFTLQGAHSKLRCDKCHPGYRYAQNIGNGSTACGACHTGPHEATFSACANCHTTSAWKPTKAITHPGTIRLGAAHESRSCTLCHPTLKFRAATTPCEDCHLSDCVHVGPADCMRCHRPTTWSDVHFTHPELGIHQGTNLNSQCLWCHPGPDFTKWQCKSCHLDGGIPMSGVWLLRHSEG